jgi:hypothetical protein
MGIVRPLVVAALVGAIAWVGYGELAERVPLPAALTLPLPLPGADRSGGGDSAADGLAPGAGSGAEDAAGAETAGDTGDAPERRFALALDAAAEQAHGLVELGETKSRNLPAILGEQGRMTARLDEIDALIAAGALPPDAAEAVAAYEAGSRSVRDAMGQAQAGLMRLDFGAVKEATERMRAGERDLARAAGLLPE